MTALPPVRTYAREHGLSRYAAAMQLLRAAWGGRCVVCGDTRRLEFAHLPGKPTGLSCAGRGRADRFQDIVRYPKCYVLLCKKDHLTLDTRKELS